NVVFRRGQYAPGTAPGARLLAHELAHVLQQRDVSQASARRAVDVAPQARLAIGSSTDPAEVEADVFADVVLAAAPPPLPGVRAPVVRRKVHAKVNEVCATGLAAACAVVVHADETVALRVAKDLQNRAPVNLVYLENTDADRAK